MPTKPIIYLPVKPLKINQVFGANIPCVKDFGLSTQVIVNGLNNQTCPVGYTKLYAAFGMKGHDGTDLDAGVQSVYNAMDGLVIEKQTVESRGFGLGIVTNQPVDLGDLGIHYLKLRYWHLKSFNVEVGDSVKIGDVIGISDSTGYSSGNHLHFEGVPMDKDSAGNYVTTFPNNGFVGAINIQPYFSNTYAQDVPQLTSYLKSLITALNALLSAVIGKRDSNV